VKIQEARNSIYKRECLEKQERGREKSGQLGEASQFKLPRSMSHPRKVSRR